MTEEAKMLAGQIYDPSDATLLAYRQHARKLCQDYNNLADGDPTRATIIQELIPNMGADCEIQGPIALDYGRFTTLGSRVFINYNFTALDCAPITIGDNVLIGPNVALLAPVHPLRHHQRNIQARPDGSLYNLEYAKPITIEKNCWLAGNVTVIGGVTIGEGSVIGAGSVVTRDIPANSLAVGNPCRVIRQITADDDLEMPEIF
ncbi:sugar O-acetyltransferase [Periweissella ghanensis]|uniref:Acetyltransferase n=1 Tax=Periweissella ghanensis TaxID=467997 RepID=A0ABM8ZC90_9LACO|nr:sugar O-acetyltransferase [Periweissella ghanensis]MCM0601899.1 sugar O-acetyltransferase [Periweissella ghanensis]CAH0418910.1 Putative acetyltransferase [Periweissella ghanensis]